MTTLHYLKTHLFQRKPLYGLLGALTGSITGYYRLAKRDPNLPISDPNCPVMVFSLYNLSGGLLGYILPPIASVPIILALFSSKVLDKQCLSSSNNSQ